MNCCYVAVALIVLSSVWLTGKIKIIITMIIITITITMFEGFELYPVAEAVV